MRVTKKGAACAVLAAVAVFLFVGACVPKKTLVEKSLSCTGDGQAEPVTVEVSGTYYAYLLRDDVFDGTIDVKGNAGKPDGLRCSRTPIPVSMTSMVSRKV